MAPLGAVEQDAREPDCKTHITVHATPKRTQRAQQDAAPTLETIQVRSRGKQRDNSVNSMEM